MELRDETLGMKATRRENSWVPRTYNHSKADVDKYLDIVYISLPNEGEDFDIEHNKALKKCIKDDKIFGLWCSDGFDENI